MEQQSNGAPVTVPDTRAELVASLRGGGPQEVVPAAVAESRVAATQAQEPAKVEPKQEAKPDRVSSRILHLSRRERELKRTEEQLRTKQKEIEGRTTQHEAPRQASLDELRLIAKTDPGKALRELGIDERYVNEFFLNDGKPTPEARIDIVKHEVQRELTQLRQEHERLRDEQRQRELERGVDDYRTMVRGFLGGDSAKDRFELLVSSVDDPVGEVEELVRQDYMRQVQEGVERPSLMAHDEAAQRLEDYLQDQAKRLLSSKKARALLGASPQDPIVTSGAEAKGAQDGPQRVEAPTEQGSSEIGDPLLAAMLRRIEAQSEGQAGSSGPSGIAVTSGHMQRVPDRNSDMTEQELREEMRRALRSGAHNG